MSFTEILSELPTLTIEQRQEVALRGLSLDDHGLSAEDEALVAQRLESHRRDPSSAIDREEMKKRVRSGSRG
jgi:hypothetical protein